MKNWFLPAAVLGLSGLGLICASERGRERLGGFFNRILEHDDPMGEFARAIDEQLLSIQRALDGLAQSLEESEA